MLSSPLASYESIFAATNNLNTNRSHSRFKATASAILFSKVVPRTSVQKWKERTMRTIKLSLIGVLAMASLLLLTNHSLPGFSTSSQSVSPAAPTEVAASDNSYVTKIGINWNAVAGATLYRVFRNATNNSATATVVGTTPEATFFDLTAPAGQTFFYWVRAESGNA